MFPAYTGLLRPIVLISVVLLFVILPGQAYEALSDETLKTLLRPNNDFDINYGALLAPILRPRVPGTPGHTTVLNHFADFFRTTLPKWTVEYQNSTYKTPVSKGKEVPFVNFIARRDPPWAAVGDVGRVTFVAHYDSKYEPKGFIGAIDSAAPCAMIMHAMRSIDDALTRKWETMEAEGHADASLEEQNGIQIIFLDGEEAFQHWTATDSLYGSRALAEHWDSEVNPAMSAFKTPLTSISLFVLLDLLGSKNPAVQSYYQTTHWAYQKIATIEKRLRDLKQFRSSSSDPWFIDGEKDDNQMKKYSGIQDDHVPFLIRGVEILHLVDAAPFKGFPKVWHTMDDDGAHLDLDTVEDWSMLTAAFAAEWMELDGYLHEPASGKRDNEKRATKYTWDKTEL